MEWWSYVGNTLQTVETVIRCFCSCNPRLKPWALQGIAAVKGQHTTARRCIRSQKSLRFYQNHVNHLNHDNSTCRGRQGSDKKQNRLSTPKMHLYSHCTVALNHLSESISSLLKPVNCTINSVLNPALIPSLAISNFPSSFPSSLAVSREFLISR